MPTVEHVIVVALENRSFDHVLGYLDHPSPLFDGLRSGGPHRNPGWPGGPAVAASPGAKMVLPLGPDHSHAGVMEQLEVPARGGRSQPTNQGFVVSLERTGRGMELPTYAGLLGSAYELFRRLFPARHEQVTGRGPLAILCQPPEHVPVLAELARQFAVCTRWFCSVPGETWPNRNFMHAATSDGETDIDTRFYANRTIFELLEEAGRSWHIYFNDTPQVWAFPRLWDTPVRHANWYPFGAFLEHAASGELPSYSFIEPNHRPPIHVFGEVGGEMSNNQHPENNLVPDALYDGHPDAGSGDFSRGEQLIATIYEALRRNPALFERSLLLVTYDEHGGLYDHVPPPTDVPNPGQAQGLAVRALHLLWRRRSATFDFRMLGPRVPAVVISPHIPPATIDTQVHDHASIPATLRALWAPGAQPLTRRDAAAHPFHHVLTADTPRRDDLPDLSAHAGGAPAPVPEGPDGPPMDAVSHLVTFYQAFVDLAERVHRRLAEVGEPEVASVVEPDARRRAVQITQAFADAAARHRLERARGGEGHASAPG